MNRLIWAIVALYLLAGCKETQTNNYPKFIRSLGSVRLSPFVDSLFKSYAKAVNSNYGYAIYIDMKTEKAEYMITFAPFIKNVGSIYSSGAVNYFMLSDSIPVFIYTGLEDFVVCDTSAFSTARETISEAKQGKEFRDKAAYTVDIDFKQAWSYVHLDDTSYIVKGNEMPFLNITLLPTMIWHVPDSSTKK